MRETYMRDDYMMNNKRKTINKGKDKRKWSKSPVVNQINFQSNGA